MDVNLLDQLAKKQERGGSESEGERGRERERKKHHYQTTTHCLIAIYHWAKRGRISHIKVVSKRDTGILLKFLMLAFAQSSRCSRYKLVTHLRTSLKETFREEEKSISKIKLPSLLMCFFR
jgi:hypothetical protein